MKQNPNKTKPYAIFILSCVVWQILVLVALKQMPSSNENVQNVAAAYKRTPSDQLTSKATTLPKAITVANRN